MAKKHEAQDKSRDKQQLEPISSPSECNEEDAEVSMSSSSDSGNDLDSEVEDDSHMSSPSPDVGFLLSFTPCYFRS